MVLECNVRRGGMLMQYNNYEILYADSVIKHFSLTFKVNFDFLISAV